MLKTEIVPCNNDKEYLTVSNEDLLKEIGVKCQLISASYAELANLIGVAIRRGLDVRMYVDKAFADVLVKIESHQIAPELAEKFMHSSHFHKMKHLPIHEQQRIAETGAVDVVVRRGDTFDLRRIAVCDLTKRQANLVFVGGRIRSEAEMIAILEDEVAEVSDPYDEALVSVKVTVELELTKTQRKKFEQLKEKAGGAGPLLKALLISKIG